MNKGWDDGIRGAIPLYQSDAKVEAVGARPGAIYKVCSSRGAIPANVQKRVDKFSRTEKSGWTIPVNERAENWRFTRTGQ